jgi:thiol-disulfide isomerase/thioredoxin
VIKSRGGAADQRWVLRVLIVVGLAVAGFAVLKSVVPMPSLGAGAASQVSTSPVSPAVVTASGEEVLTSGRVSLDDYPGKPLVVNIWASWCEGCTVEAPEIVKLAAARPDVPIVGIDYQDQRPNAADAARRWGWKHPSIFDPTGEVGWGIDIVHDGLPTTLFLNSRHQVVARIVGNATLADLEDGVRRAHG